MKGGLFQFAFTCAHTISWSLAMNSGLFQSSYTSAKAAKEELYSASTSCFGVFCITSNPLPSF